MPSKNRKRWPPSLNDVKKVVAIVAAEVTTGSVTDIFHAVRRRCPEWAVTPHRVRKALASLQHSKKRGGKKSSSSSGSSSDNHTRVYPHDVVELKPSAARARHAPWQWHGQVLRVAGYDDGETTDDEDQELPVGHCSVFWLGYGLEQWPNALTKEYSLRVVDRPWVLGDRVAKADDPRSLGTVVGVNCRLRVSAIPGPMPPSPEVSVQAVRAVGGFRAEDWVASEATRWVGKVEEAVFRVEVELCGRPDQRVRGKGRHKPPVCVFQVSSEGLQGLEPAGGEDVTPQELSPHFPGQRVRAPPRLWRQAEWIRGSLGRRSPRRGVSICGVVTSVECCLLAVRWLAGVMKDSHPPDEWVSPDALRPLLVPNSSEGWAIGDHVQAPPDSSYASAVIVESHTVVSVRWADGTVEEDVNSVKLCPRPHISAHDFLPLDFVARSSEGFAEPMVQTPQVGMQTTRMDTENVNQNQENLYSEANCTANSENIMYEYAAEGEEMDNNSEIVSTEGFVTPQVDTPLGVVTNVNLQARTAEVQWVGGTAGEAEEVSVFELTDHPQVDVRLGDAVLIPIAQDRQWAGRVCGLRADGCAMVELLDGTSRWHDVRNLIVIDDGEGTESMDDGMGSEAEGGSTRSDGALSEVSEGHEADARSELSEEWQDPEEEPQAMTPRESVEDSLGPFERARQDFLAKVLAERDASEAAVSCQSEAEAEGVDASGTATPTPDATDAAQEGGACSSAALAEILPFDVCEEDVEPTDHFFLQQSTLGTRALMMAVRREMVVLRKGLLEGSEGVPAPIIVRTFSSRSDLFRAMVVGPPETPYANVPFFFDLALPSEYPREPPLAHFHAHYVGNERLNPNLYVDGKVCLSLLGTWSGPSWDPARSTLLQVLVSLQGLVLVEEPYFNEPGHECDAGTEQGQQSSNLYNEHARLLALRAALNVAQSPPRGFHQIVANFFQQFGPKLVEQCEEALQEPKAAQSSEGFRKVLAKTLLPRLRERWGSKEASGSSS